MNILAEFIGEYRMNPRKALNLLQNKGIISDNVILLEDVADADCPAAIEFLKQYLGVFHSRGPFNRTCGICGQPLDRCCC